MEFLAVLCVMVLLTPGIAFAAATSASNSAQTQTTPPAADQLPAPREKIHFAPYEPMKSIEGVSSSYIPLDSWIYPAVLRLYGMGYVDTLFVSMRPLDPAQRCPHAGGQL